MTDIEQIAGITRRRSPAFARLEEMGAGALLVNCIPPDHADGADRRPDARRARRQRAHA